MCPSTVSFAFEKELNENDSLFFRPIYCNIVKITITNEQKWRIIMILSCSNIDKTFVDNHVIKNASFHIEDYEKAAIVGINGAGKSTLLKIIVGDLPADAGLVTFAKDKSFGYLAQHQAVDSENTLFDELLTVKQEVLELESSIRQCELDMKSTDGDALELLLKKESWKNHVTYSPRKIQKNQEGTH